MKIETTFNCGDRVWVRTKNNQPMQGTIGQVRVSITESKRINNGVIDDSGVSFGNYKPQLLREESYMLEETGIGSGFVYIPGRDLFDTLDECTNAIAKIKSDYSQHEHSSKNKQP